jgi:adenylate kinase family enzyme
LILGLSGKRGTGKTTTANYLVKYYGFKKLSFADLLKTQASKVFEFTEEQLNGKEKEKPYFKNGETPRDFFIKYGQLIRYFDSEYWVTETLKQAHKLPRVVIDDVRYPNEIEGIKKAGECKIIRLERYKHLNIYKTELNDESETLLDYYSFDKVINEVENISYKSLYTRLDLLMDELGYKAK